MRQRNEKIKFYEGHRIDAKWMRICEGLLTNLVYGVYWEDKYDHEPLNFRNLDATPKEIELAQERICETDDGFFHKGEDLGAGHRAELRERKAKKLLFKILEWRVEYWWD